MGRCSDAKEKLLDAAHELLWEHSYGATSVDAICEKAGVKKGSFYHFFESKSELALAALEANWQANKARYDAIFSPTVPPLERIQKFLDGALKCQEDCKEQSGQVLGCPVFSLGCEISTQDEAIREKVAAILANHIKYVESAIRDAQAEGLINAPDPGQRARLFFFCFQGALTQARIQNCTSPLCDFRAGAMQLLGLAKSVPAQAAAVA